MERYQEALDKLKIMGDKDLYNERHLEWAKILQELIDILKEYNITQSNIREILLAGNQFEHLIEKANKYDEKETPKKVINRNAEAMTEQKAWLKEHEAPRNVVLPVLPIYKCPVCNQDFGFSFKCNYCKNCGQKLDWEVENNE